MCKRHVRLSLDWYHMNGIASRIIIIIFLRYKRSATLTHWDREKMATILQCILLNEHVWVSIAIFTEICS